MTGEQQRPSIEEQMIVTLAGMMGKIATREITYLRMEETLTDPTSKAKALGAALGLSEALMVLIGEESSLNPITPATLGDTRGSSLRAQEMRRPENGGLI